MRKLITIILTVFFLMGCLPEEYYTITLETPDLSTVEDGRYYGSYEGQLVSAEVHVNMTNCIITQIDILKHDCLLGRNAESITYEVIAQQSLEVDTVSGATVSSLTILKAIENALRGKPSDISLTALD